MDDIFKDIISLSNYPLKILLIRNDSSLKYQERKGCLLNVYNLYDKVISSLKYFIQSNWIKALFEKYNK